MAMNQIQFQPGLSMHEFFDLTDLSRDARRHWSARAGRRVFVARAVRPLATVCFVAGP